MTVGLPCPNCRLPLPGNYWNAPQPLPCPGCNRQVILAVFPAYLRPVARARPAEAIIESGVASCFNHEGKKAVATCESCGRFLCSLCELELNGRRLCPACLEQQRLQGNQPSLETRRLVYDQAALMLAVLPILIWPISLVTAPAAIGCGIFSFFRPASILGRRPVRAVLGILLGGVELALWIYGLLALWNH